MTIAGPGLALLAASLLIALVAGYFGSQVVEKARVRAFADRNPIKAAILVGILLTLALAAFFASHWIIVGRISVGQLRFLIGSAIYMMSLVVPASVILRRMGFSSWWAALAFLPVAPVIGLWVLAVRTWPAIMIARR